MDHRRLAEGYREDCVRFLRELIKLPSESAQEKTVAERIKAEMEHLGFDEAFIDDYGNVIGRIGHGPVRLVYDGHIDTVGIGNPTSWSYDPYKGKLEDGFIFGRGASDNKQAPVVQVYGAKLFADHGGAKSRFSLFVVGSVQEEDCDGLGLRHALERTLGKIDYVCIGEATNLDVYRGHRGRMEIEVEARGISCHGSAPERGDNAIYRMLPLVGDIERLNERLAQDAFLGKGTCTVTHIACKTPSLCAVPDSCRIHVDRRLTKGETKDSALQEIRDLPGFDAEKMTLELPVYDTPSHTGKVLTTEKYFPTWVLPEDHALVRAGVEAATKALGRKPGVSKWVFSTNGIASMGQLGIPSIGFGPGNEVDAHSVNDRVRIEDLVTAVAYYAALPDASAGHLA